MGMVRTGRWALLLVALMPLQAMAAVDAYMTIVGATQGKIMGGNVKQGGASEEIPLLSVIHNVSSPRDAATGLASGKRQHGTITVVKEIDAASPKFAQAFDTNEVLREVVIAYRSGGTGAAAGKTKTAQRIMLTNATITGLQKVGNTERITIDYLQIEVTYVNGSKAATDDWDAK